MKTWFSRALLGVFGASVLFGGLAACSYRMHSPWGGHHLSEAERAEWRERMVDRASRKLDLDAAQKAKLNTLATTLAAQSKAMHAGVEPHAELKAVLAGPQLDRSRAQALVDAKTTALREASPAVIAAVADFYDSLRPEQQQKVRGYLERGGHRGWRG